MKMSVNRYIPAKSGISQAALGRFMQCRQKAKLAMEGWRPIRSTHAQAFGKIFHDMLEGIYSLPSTVKKCVPSESSVSRVITNTTKKYEEEAGPLADDSTLSQLEEDISLASILLRAYIKRYSTDFTKKVWTGLEAKFEVFYNGAKLMGYMDGSYLLKKDHWIFETKTKSRLSTSIVDMLSLDFQSFYYLHGYLLKHGVLPKGILYNIVRKTELRRKAGESLDAYMARVERDVQARPDFYFIRYEIVIPKQDYQTWLKEQLDVVLREFVAWSTPGTFPNTYMNTSQCETKFGACEYLPICANGNYSCFENNKEGRKGGRK